MLCRVVLLGLVGVLLAALSLAGCGGGGGSSPRVVGSVGDPAPPSAGDPLPPPASAAAPVDGAAPGGHARPPVLGKWIAQGQGADGGGLTFTFVVERVAGRLAVDHVVEFCGGIDGQPDGDWQRQSAIFDPEPWLGSPSQYAVYRLSSSGEIVTPEVAQSGSLPSSGVDEITGWLSGRSGFVVPTYDHATSGPGPGKPASCYNAPGTDALGRPVGYPPGQPELPARPANWMAVRDGEWRLSGSYGSTADVGVWGDGTDIGIESFDLRGPANIEGPLSRWMGPSACEAQEYALATDTWARLVSTDGSFGFDGETGPPGYNTPGWTLMLDGRFVSPTEATGTFDVRLSGAFPAPCDSGTHRFTMRLVQPSGEPGNASPPAEQPGSLPRKLTYVALGDSFSSGEGAGGYAPPTNIRGQNVCHRSEYAYPERLGSSPRQPVFLAGRSVSLQFWACSGATTANVVDKPQGKAEEEPPQITHVDSSDDLVTLTIGGNDAGFARMVNACLRFPVRYLGHIVLRKWPIRCRPETAAKRIGALAGPLERTFAAVRAQAPHAAVIALDYPQLFPAGPEQQRCQDLSLFKPGSVEVLRKATDDLDDAIKKAAVKAGVQFLDVRDDFQGHEVCMSNNPESSSIWINRLDVRNLSESLHPNFFGQQQYANAIVAFIQQKLASGADRTPAGLPANPPPEP